MRVLVLSNLYPSPVFPTRGQFNRHPLRLLAGRHAVRVIVPVSWTDELAARRRRSGFCFGRRRQELDGLTVDYPRYLFLPRVFRGLHGRFFLASVRRSFWRAVEEFQPDILLATWAFPDGWAGVKLARCAGIPVVVKVHGSDIKLLQQNSARYHRTAEALQAADAVVAVSNDLREHVVSMGVDPRAVRLIYNGVDSDSFRPGSKAEARNRLGLCLDSPLILFVGNLFPVKGVDVLLSTIALLLTKGVPSRLTIIGKGPLLRTLGQQATDLNISDRVAFLEPISQRHLAVWYQAADVFVLPSRSEGVPNVLLEASACACPWVASRVGGIPEIAHMGQSRLVPPDDPDCMAAGIQDLLGRPPNELHVPRSWANAVDELERVLLEVLASRAA